MSNLHRVGFPTISIRDGLNTTVTDKMELICSFSITIKHLSLYESIIFLKEKETPPHTHTFCVCISNSNNYFQLYYMISLASNALHHNKLTEMEP